MITSIELKIVSDDSLPAWQLEAFIEKAKAQGITADELLVRLMRREIETQTEEASA